MQNPFGNGNNDDDDKNLIPIPPNYATIVKPETGEIRIAKVGFSFTSFFFDVLPSIFRADWYNLLCMVLVQIIVSLGVVMWSPVPAVQLETVLNWAFGILWGFLYNMMYFKHKFNQGYVPADERSKELLIEAKYLNPNK
ncbi:hypothetical protein PL11_002160 [Lentilactobacillus curieae]|uniref:Uncharacterized protein n=1 Tax=Lentilactobacillus curieae TaxID=1138822 RepID=A0A1S6QGS1_9LACO|nr:hypothetical protein [Lentilactobacillus curieae]AQW20800.1 hypothetical protein PL11_002160 [Lentilactobacillus curieae]